MNLQIRGSDVQLAAAIKHHAERRLGFALSRFERRIREITVQLRDVNGPRGGVDKQCQIALHLAPSGTLVLQETSSDLVTAIDRAADRLGYTLSRKLHRDHWARYVHN